MHLLSLLIWLCIMLICGILLFLRIDEDLNLTNPLFLMTKYVRDITKQANILPSVVTNIADKEMIIQLEKIGQLASAIATTPPLL